MSYYSWFILCHVECCACRLAKIHNALLDTSHSARLGKNLWGLSPQAPDERRICARNLCFIFDEHLSPTKLQLSSNPVTITFVNFAVSGLTLIRQLPVPLLPLSFTPNSITVILSTINSLSLNYPVSSRSRTLLLVLSWKLPNPIISLPPYALFTGSGSLNASNTSSSHLPTKFSQLSNLHTFITSSPFNVLSVLALHPSLLLLGRHHPL